MFIHLYDREVKGEAPAGACPRCAGAGIQGGGRESDPAPCALCDGFGRLRLVERPAPEPAPRYLVTVGDGLVETGNELAGLVRQVCRDWSESADDLAVWQERDGGVRLVAVVRPGPRGPEVTYL